MGFGIFFFLVLVDRVGSVRMIVVFNGSVMFFIVGMLFLLSFLFVVFVYIIRMILMNIVNFIWDVFMMCFFLMEECLMVLVFRNFLWMVIFGMG